MNKKLTLVSRKVTPYASHDYLYDCITKQWVSDEIDRGSRFQRDRQAIIDRHNLTPETGKKWLVEALHEDADELERLLDSDEFEADWEAIKRSLDDIEAIFRGKS